MRIAFFTSRSAVGSMGFNVAKDLLSTHDWKCYTIETEKDPIPKPHWDVIISFLNPFIIPESWLKTRAYNIHPATPDFPGRDPQNWAIYSGATHVGATLHEMVKKVDSGPILGAVRERWEGSSLTDYIERSEQMALGLLVMTIGDLLEGSLSPLDWLQWADNKHSRKDFQEMCQIPLDCSRDELEKRLRGFYHPQYRSIHTILHGHRFVYEPEGNHGKA